MSSAARPSDPCLLAVLLVIQARTGTGAQIVYHYPPNPLSGPDSRERGSVSPGNDESSSSDSDSESSSDDNDFQAFLSRTKPAGPRQQDEQSLTIEDEDYRDSAMKTPTIGKAVVGAITGPWRRRASQSSCSRARVAQTQI